MEAKDSVEREAKLKALYGRLPSSWKFMSDLAMKNWDTERQLKKRGWITITKILKLMGLGQSDWIKEELSKWLAEIGWESRTTEEGERLSVVCYYAPITLDEILRHPAVPVFFKRILGDTWPILVRAFMNDDFRASCLADLMAEGN